MRKCTRTAHHVTYSHISLFVVVLVLGVRVGHSHSMSSMELVYTWGTPTFVFESDQQRQELQENGNYTPGNSVIFDIAFGPNGTVFVTLPSMLDGSPATLATLEDVRQRQPRLVPYPDWSWHAGARGCDGLTSVFRVFTDLCGRLWVIDSGIVDIGNTFRRRCPAQLLAFNMTTNELLVRHQFQLPQESCLESLILNVIVEQVNNSCSDVYAYAADTSGFAIYVYSLASNSSWRVPSDLFFPDVNMRRFAIAGTTFSLMDGVLALALSGEKRAEDRFLYFHATTSRQEGRVRTSILRNPSLFADGINGAPDEFEFVGYRECQAAGEAMTSNNILFSSPLCDNTIVCWNVNGSIDRYSQSVVQRNDRLLRFVASLKVVPRSDGSGEDLWAVANNGQHLFSGDYTTTVSNITNAINILRGDVRQLVYNTPCCRRRGYFPCRV